MQKTRVREIMSSPAIVAAPDTSVPAANTLMKERGIRHLPIVENGRLVGIVSRGDLREASISASVNADTYEFNFLLSRLTVDRLMTRRVLTVTPDAPVGGLRGRADDPTQDRWSAGGRSGWLCRRHHHRIGPAQDAGAQTARGRRNPNRAEHDPATMTQTSAIEPSLARYARQIIFPGVGEAGQRALLQARVTIVGVGATGSVLANHLARAGVGFLRLIDRDYIELNNLQRQLLYDEEDIAALLPKAVAAAQKLRRINSSIAIEDVVADVTPANIAGFVSDADLVLDGTDNFATRYLINDVCVKLGKPWIYCGVIAAYGMTMTIQPHHSPCLRCVMGEMPAPGTVPTCDVAGVVGPIVALMGSIVSAEAIKLIVGRGTPNTGMIYADVWEGSFDRFDLGGPRPDCPTCGRSEYAFLSAESGTRTTSLCGRDAVHVSVVGARSVDLRALADRLQAAGVGAVDCNPYLLRAEIDGYDFTVFSDGRAIIKGTADEARASTLYARYIGM
jgi:molybdopterin-synthase adenylyltransferase